MHIFLAQATEHLPIPVAVFGNQIRLRRLELGINIRRAASMTGMTRDDWQALEAGWVPTQNERLLRSLAGTLQVSFDSLTRVVEPLVHHFEDTAE